MSIFKRKSSQAKEVPVTISEGTLEETVIEGEDNKVKINSFMKSLKDKRDRKRGVKPLTSKNGG